MEANPGSGNWTATNSITGPVLSPKVVRNSYGIPGEWLYTSPLGHPVNAPEISSISLILLSCEPPSMSEPLILFLKGKNTHLYETSRRSQHLHQRTGIRSSGESQQVTPYCTSAPFSDHSQSYREPLIGSTHTVARQESKYAQRGR